MAITIPIGCDKCTATTCNCYRTIVDPYEDLRNQPNRAERRRIAKITRGLKRTANRQARRQARKA